jgi:L-asparagine oxygenase
MKADSNRDMRKDRTMEYDFVFTDDEHAQYLEALESLPPTPYADHNGFLDASRQLQLDDRIPQRFVDFCDDSMNRELEDDPITVIGNCPIDGDLPVFDSLDPVNSKYSLKKTFVAEGFLATYAVLTDTEVIAHRTVNDGDFYHDIYPKESMFETQSQKTLKTLKFHRDFTNHFASPDFVNTLTLRDTPENEVYSTFAVNKDVIADLDDDLLAVLREERFYTPFDDVSTSNDSVGLGRAKNHPIVIGTSGLRVFEGRTEGLDCEAKDALDLFLDELHAHKLKRVSRPGDSVTFSNVHVVHGREVGEVRNLAELKQRWLMKTHNVFSLAAFERWFEPARYGVVNG